jgi:hypothetical protein
MNYALSVYVKENGKRKLLGGTIYMQKMPDKIIDENVNIEELYLTLPNLVRIKKELNKTAVKEYLKNGDTSLYDFGIDIREGEESLRIKNTG